MQLNYPPLSQVTDEYINTDAAAHYLNRKAGTLLAWACGRRKSPITPRRESPHLRRRHRSPPDGSRTV